MLQHIFFAVEFVNLLCLFRILESCDKFLLGQTHPSLPVSASIVWLSSVFFKWKIHFSTFYYFSFITEQNHLWQFAGYGDEFLCFQFNRWPFYWINDVLIFDSNQMTSIFCDTNEWQLLTNWKTHDINGKRKQDKIYLDNLRSRMIRCSKCGGGRQTWDLSKILHHRILRPNILHP